MFNVACRKSGNFLDFKTLRCRTSHCIFTIKNWTSNSARYLPSTIFSCRWFPCFFFVHWFNFFFFLFCGKIVLEFLGKGSYLFCSLEVERLWNSIQAQIKFWNFFFSWPGWKKTCGCSSRDSICIAFELDDTVWCRWRENLKAFSLTYKILKSFFFLFNLI